MPARGQFARQHAAGTYFVGAGLEGIHAKVELAGIVSGDSGGANSESGKVAMVIPGVAIGVLHFVVDVVADLVGKKAEPLLDLLVLLRSAYAGGAHFEVSHRSARQQPLLHIVGLVGWHGRGPGLGRSSGGEQGIDALRSGAAAVAKVGVGGLGGPLAEVVGCFGGFFVGGLFCGIDDGVVRVDVVALGIERLGEWRRIGTIVGSVSERDGSAVPRRLELFSGAG